MYPCETFNTIKRCVLLHFLQPEGLDAEADAEANRIIAEITGEALASAGAAPAASVARKQAAAPAAAEEPQEEVGSFSNISGHILCQYVSILWEENVLISI